MKDLVFVSGVQKELAVERRAAVDLIRGDPLLGRFLDLFLFEDLPPRDRRADDFYTEKVDQASVYVGIFGNEYGFEDGDGVSPTEREFDRATERGITRLIFVKGDGDAGRTPKMVTLVRKATGQLIRRRFGSSEELVGLLRRSLVDYLESRGAIQGRSVEERPCPGATVDDVDTDAVARFVGRARRERQFPLSEQASVVDVLTHLNLLTEAGTNPQPSTAAILLFGRTPQRFAPGAELRCMHFHGIEVEVLEQEGVGPSPQPGVRVAVLAVDPSIIRTPRMSMPAIFIQATSTQRARFTRSYVRRSSTPLRIATTLRRRRCRCRSSRIGSRSGTLESCLRA